MERGGSLPRFLTLPRYPTKISCTPTISNLYLATSLAAVLNDPDLQRLLTFHVPNLMSPFHFLGCTKDHNRPGEHAPVS